MGTPNDCSEWYRRCNSHSLCYAWRRYSDRYHAIQRANCRTPRSPALVLYLRPKREQKARLWRIIVSSDPATADTGESIHRGATPSRASDFEKTIENRPIPRARSLVLYLRRNGKQEARLWRVIVGSDAAKADAGEYIAQVEAHFSIVEPRLPGILPKYFAAWCSRLSGCFVQPPYTNLESLWKQRARRLSGS